MLPLTTRLDKRQCSIRKAGRMAAHTVFLESTRGHHALKHKYHLPLNPPPPINLCFLFKFKSKFVTT